METTLIAIPPKDGIAMGTIMSEPLPVDVNTGISAKKVVAVVIRQGRTRLIAFKTFLFG
jgi:hypothetical protein